MASKERFLVERSALIEAPPSRIFGLLSDFHNWMSWSPWEGMDPDQRRTYSGSDSGVGAVYEWSGNRKVGQGRMEITDVADPTTVRIKLNFIKPFKAQNMATFTLTPEGESTHVIWAMTGPMTLLTKVMGIFTSMDKMIGPDFEKGLAQLKAHAEQRAD